MADAHFYGCFPSPADVVYDAFVKRTVGGKITFEGRIASPIGITQIVMEDPAESTVSLYEKIHDGLYKRMREDKIVRVEERNDTKIAIGVYGKNLFDSVNEEMKGKMKLAFIPADTYYQMCGKKK